MMWEVPDEAIDLYRVAEKRPLRDPAERQGAHQLGRAEIEQLLPHRDPFLLVHRVTAYDLVQNWIVARYDLAHSAPILAGHFPGRPLWPGVLQIEAVGQVGLLLAAMQQRTTGTMVATHINAARFIRPIEPGSDVEMVASFFEDGLFFVVVGQCLQQNAVCSAVILSGLSD